MKLSRSKNGTFMGNYIGETNASRVRAVKLKRMARKETGWDNNIKPISKFNSQVHPSMRIPFEQI